MNTYIIVIAIAVLIFGIFAKMFRGINTSNMFLANWAAVELIAFGILVCWIW